MLATFYVLECPSYHWILGLTLLQRVDGVVHCRRQVLQFSTEHNNDTTLHELALVPRSVMQQSPAFQLHFSRTDTTCHTATVYDPAAPIATPTSWAEAALSIEEVAYVGDELVSVLGSVAVTND